MQRLQQRKSLCSGLLEQYYTEGNVAVGLLLLLLVL